MAFVLDPAMIYRLFKRHSQAMHSLASTPSSGLHWPEKSGTSFIHELHINSKQKGRAAQAAAAAAEYPWNASLSSELMSASFGQRKKMKRGAN